MTRFFFDNLTTSIELMRAGKLRAPRPVVDAYNAEMKVWLAGRKTLEPIEAVAGFPAYGTLEQFKGFVDGQIALWRA